MSASFPRLATLLGHSAAYDILASAVAVIGADGAVHYANPAFQTLQQTLHIDTKPAPDAPPWWQSAPITAARETAIDTCQVVTHPQCFHYDVNVTVHCTLVFTPLLDEDGSRAIAVLLTIAEESIEHDRRHLARFQQLRGELAERVRVLSTEQIEKDELIRALLSETPFGVLIFDGQRRLLRMNRYAERLYRHPSRELLGMSCEHFIDCYGHNKACPVLDGGEIIRNEEVIGLRAARPPLPLLRSAVLLTGSATPVIVEAVIDISERKQAEQELERYRRHLETMVAERTAELEAFSYSISHDLRGPLRAIDGYSLLLAEDYREQLDETAIEHLQRVRRASQQMGRIIDSLLTLSRMGRSELVRAPVDLGHMACEVIAALREAEPARQVEVDVHPALHVEADPFLMRVVLENLLGNAWKFTARREPARIEFGMLDDDGRRCFFVRDNGAGFDMRFQNKLFKAFERLHDAAQFRGTGIGLASVARIIHRHGGEVWAVGAPDQGATFYFTL